MSYLYLDHNIYIYALNNPSILEKISILKNLGIRCLYSPAHIEEIYAAKVKCDDYVNTSNKLLEVISTITDNYECLPSKSTSIKIVQEFPNSCLERVEKYDTVEYVNNDSRLKFDIDIEYYKGLINSDKQNTNISNLKSDKIWSHPVIEQTLNYINQNIECVIENNNSSIHTIICACQGINKTLPESFRLQRGSFGTIKKSHTQLEFSIEILFRILNQNGYNAEKELSKAISSTHDVSHAIYATVAQWFLTTDRRFFAKCSAVYSYLGMPTKVIFAERDKITVELDKIANIDIGKKAINVG